MMDEWIVVAGVLFEFLVAEEFSGDGSAHFDDAAGGRFFEHDHSAAFPPVDFARVAQAHGEADGATAPGDAEEVALPHHGEFSAAFEKLCVGLWCDGCDGGGGVLRSDVERSGGLAAGVGDHEKAARRAFRFARPLTQLSDVSGTRAERARSVNGSRPRERGDA